MLVPSKLAAIIWQESIQSAHIHFPGCEIHWKWARLKKQWGREILRHHVLVSEGTRASSREQLKLKKSLGHMIFYEGQTKWTHLCDFFREGMKMTAKSNELMLCEPCPASDLCSLCVSRAKGFIRKKKPPIFQHF